MNYAEMKAYQAPAGRQSKDFEMYAELSPSEYLLVRQDLHSALQAVVKSFDTLAIVSTPTENGRVIYRMCYLRLEMLSKFATFLWKFLLQNHLCAISWLIDSIIQIFKFVKQIGDTMKKQCTDVMLPQWAHELIPGDCLVSRITKVLSHVQFLH